MVHKNSIGALCPCRTKWVLCHHLLILITPLRTWNIIYKVQVSTFGAQSDRGWRGFCIYRLTSAKRYHVQSAANTSHFPTSQKEILLRVSGIWGMFLSRSCSACCLPLFAHWQRGDRFLSPADLNSLLVNLFWRSRCGEEILWIIIWEERAM